MNRTTIIHPSIFISLVLLAGLLIWFAPDERTLGSGIKVVYLHVALIWAGMTGIVIVGIVGLVSLFKPRAQLLSWSQDLGWITLGFFLAGIGLSMVAAIVNWGGIFWQEPRMVAMLQVVAVALIIQIVNSWLSQLRFMGLLYVGLAGFLIWSVRNTALILHPRNPIGTSSSFAIQATFFGLFGLTFLLMIWLLVRWRMPPASTL